MRYEVATEISQKLCPNLDRQQTKNDMLLIIKPRGIKSPNTTKVKVQTLALDNYYNQSKITIRRHIAFMFSKYC